MAQIPACITEYTDAEKECASSAECEGNCVKTHSEKPAMCEKTSSEFRCKTTIEKFNIGKGILCID